MTKQTCASKSKVALNAAFAAILAVGLSVPAASAFAAPSDDKQAEAQAALQKLNQYQSELDQASANYEAAHQEQIDAQNRVDEAQKQIEEKTAQIEKDQQRLSDRARDMYRSGDTNFLDVILGASSFEQFATTWNMLETLNGNDAELVSETKTAREDLQAAKQEAEEQAKVASDKAEEAKKAEEQRKKQEKAKTPEKKKAPEKKNGEDGLPIPPYAVYNIGNQNPENLLDFVQILSEELVRAKVLPEDYDFEAHKELVPMQPGDVPVTYADTSALECDFGYKPSTSLREGLRKFAEWYAKFYK